MCTNEGLSYPKCVPRAEIPTYIPVPTEVCVGPGKPCSTRSCCAGLTCTAEALAYPQCVENCSLLTNRPDNCKCTNNTHCKSKNCSGGVCKPSGRVSQPPISDKCPEHRHVLTVRVTYCVIVRTLTLTELPEIVFVRLQVGRNL